MDTAVDALTLVDGMGTEVVDGEGATVDGDRTRIGTVVGTAVAGVIAMLVTRFDNASSWARSSQTSICSPSVSAGSPQLGLPVASKTAIRLKRSLRPLVTRSWGIKSAPDSLL